jgi:hypothetical protein
MAISDVLEKIGEGVKTGAKAVGAVAEPILERTAQVESGEAPQIDEEQRRRATELEDAQINAKATALENQLAMGQKYGTLTPQQQQQYVDQITGLYSHPRHAQTLMEKLRKTIHPQGTFAQGPQAPLANATPEGGTAGADARLANTKKGVHPVPGVHPFKAADGQYYQPMYSPDGSVVNELVEGYTPPEAKGGGKSPPVTGDQLPPDAIGVNGDPIPPEQRNAGKSFVEFQGKWWGVAPPKPKLTELRGHMVLVDGTGKVLRDLGMKDAVKVTTRDTLQPGDDGQMHLVKLTSVTTPEGASIEVDSGESSSPQPATASQPSAAPKKGIGSVLPKRPSTGARMVTPPAGGSAGRVVPGLHTLAMSKNPLFKADTASYKKANDDAIAKGELYKNAQGLLADNNRVTDLDLIFAWVRSNIQGAGRITNTEIQQAAKAGSYGTRIKSAFDQASTGRISPELEQQFLSDIKRSAETSQQVANDLKNQLGATDSPTPAAPAGGVENWVRDSKTGKLVKQ